MIYGYQGVYLHPKQLLFFPAQKYGCQNLTLITQGWTIILRLIVMSVTISCHESINLDTSILENVDISNHVTMS